MSRRAKYTVIDWPYVVFLSRLYTSNWEICHCLSQNMTHRSIKCKISDLLAIIDSLNFLEKGSLGEKYHILLQNKVRCSKKGGNREKGRSREVRYAIVICSDFFPILKVVILNYESGKSG